MPESGNIKWTASIPSKGTIIYDICNKTYKNLKLRIKIQITKKVLKIPKPDIPKTLNFKWERALWTLNGVSSGPLTTSHISNMYKKFPFNLHYKTEPKIILVKIPIKKHRNL